MKVTTLHCQDDKFGIRFWLEKDGRHWAWLFTFSNSSIATQVYEWCLPPPQLDFLNFDNVWFLGGQINEEEYKEKCGGGPPGKDKCPPINGIKRVNTSCAEEETRPGGRCKLECEEAGVQLGVGHEMHAHLVCEEKGGGVSLVNISIYSSKYNHILWICEKYII